MLFIEMKESMSLSLSINFLFLLFVCISHLFQESERSVLGQVHFYLRSYPYSHIVILTIIATDLLLSSKLGKLALSFSFYSLESTPQRSLSVEKWFWWVWIVRSFSQLIWIKLYSSRHTLLICPSDQQRKVYQSNL